MMRRWSDCPSQWWAPWDRRAPARRRGAGLGVVLAVILVAAWLVDGQHAAAQAPPQTLDQYAQAVDEAASLLAGSGEPEDAQARLKAARQRLAGIETVELPSGAVVTVASLLSPEEADLTPEDAQVRLDAVQSQLAAAANDRTAPRLALLAQVLARPEFAVQETPWQRFRRWLAERLARWLPDVGPPAARGRAVDVTAEALVWAAGAAGLLLLAGLLSYWLQGLLRNFVVDTEVGSGHDREGGRPASPEQARTQAAAFARAGNYREAVRQLYLAALLTMEEHGLAPRNRSLTNREVLAQVGPTGSVASHLSPVVDTFDAVWYGVQEPNQAVYQSYAAEIDALTDAAQRDPGSRQKAP